MNAQAVEALSVHYLTRSRELAALRPEWEALWMRSSRPTPFNAPAWLIPWWRTFGNGCLRVCTIRKEGRLVGILPAYLLEGRLQLVGVGMSDYLDVLAERDLEKDVAEIVLLSTTILQKEWRETEFQNLASGSPLLECGRPPWWRDERFAQDVCPGIALPRSVFELASTLPPGQYRNYSYSRRRIEREEPFSLERGTAGGFQEACEGLFRLHREQWKARGTTGVVTGQTSSFLKKGIEGLQRMGVTRWHLMRHRGEIVGVLLGFALRKRFHYYISGVHPGFRKYGVGNVLVGDALHRAVEEGHEIFDFLRGGESYKYSWGAVDQPLWSRIVREN